MSSVSDSKAVTGSNLSCQPRGASWAQGRSVLCPAPSFVHPPPARCLSVMNYSVLPFLRNEALLCLRLASTSGCWHFSLCSSCGGVSALTPQVEGSSSPSARASPAPGPLPPW